MAHFLLTPALSLLICLQGEFLAKPHDVLLAIPAPSEQRAPSATRA